MQSSYQDIIRRLPHVIAAVLTFYLSSCISPDQQFKNSTHPKAAELRTKRDGFLSTAYANGVWVRILELDGKTTSGDFKGVPEPYLLSPGAHLLAITIIGSWSTYVDGFVKITVKPGNKYVLRGKHVGSVFVLEIVNTTSGQEIVEESFRVIQQNRPTPMYVPVVVPS